MTTKRAFLYDFLQVRGGAEQVALHVAEVFPDVDCTCGFIEPGAFPELAGPASRFSALTTPTTIAGWQAVKTLRAFEYRTKFLSDYQSVVYSGVYAPVAVGNHGRGRDIYYCHTPPRFVYDLRDYYREIAAPWQRPLLDALVRFVRPRFESAVKRMDVVLANSHNVRRRLESHLGLSSVEVLHPPVDTRGYRWAVQGDYYLSTARLEPYKRVELAVRAFMRMPGRRLLVCSGGSEGERLKKMARGHSNIVFTGWCTQAEMKELVGGCVATLYLARDEDFGMSPVESLAAGKPVIGAAEGGLLETVDDERTGLLIDSARLGADDEAAVEAVVEAVEQLSPKVAMDMRGECERRAVAFDSSRFDARLRELLYG